MMFICRSCDSPMPPVTVRMIQDADPEPLCAACIVTLRRVLDGLRRAK